MRTLAHAALSGAALLIVVAACSSASPSATAAPTLNIVGGITLSAPTEAKAGSDVEVSWTGTEGRGDAVMIVPVGQLRAFPETPYVNAVTNPLSIKAPATPGNYEIWFLEGDTVDRIKARLPLKVT